MDQGRRCTSRLKVNATNYASYHVTDDTELVVKTDIGGIGWPASTTFASSVAGTRKDNPLFPDKLTDLQASRAVTLRYSGVKFFSLGFDIGAGVGGRNLLFAGLSSLTQDVCGTPAA